MVTAILEVSILSNYKYDNIFITIFDVLMKCLYTELILNVSELGGWYKVRQ